MKTSRLTALVLMVTVVLSAASVLAARKTATVEGILGVTAEGNNLLKSRADSDTGYFFDPESEAGKKILSVCQTGKMCVVRGVVNFKQIVNAYQVKIGQ